MGTLYLRYLVKGRKQHAAITNDQPKRHTKTTHDCRPFYSLGYAETKSTRQKKERIISLSQCNMSRTIGRHSSSKATSSNTKKRIHTSRQEHNGKHDGISSSSCIWTRTTNKKVAHFVPLSCFCRHISCHFWGFDDITETPGSAWAITESDSSFPLCSFSSFLLRTLQTIDLICKNLNKNRKGVFLKNQ